MIDFENNRRVLKHCLSSRLLHWGLVFGFIPAAITGFIIWLKSGSGDFVNLAIRIHIIGAIIMTLSAVTYTVASFERVVAFIRSIFSWSKNDIEWLKVGGGYPQKMFLGKELQVPPMGKINSGQKIMGIIMLFGGVFMMVSGWILYEFIPLVPKAFIYWLDFYHLWIGIFLSICLIAHIFLGIYNWGEFKCMFGDGTQSLAEVKKHNPLWVEYEIELIKHESNVDKPQNQSFN